MGNLEVEGGERASDQSHVRVRRQGLFQLLVVAAMEATRIIDALHDGRVYDFSFERAKGWEELVFHGPETGIGFPKMNPSVIVEDCPWKQMKFVCLARFERTEDELIELLEKCDLTLQGLCLAEVFLTEGEWEVFFGRMAGSLEKGTCIELKGRFSSLQAEREILVGGH